MTNEPTVICALKDKAAVLRQIAHDMKFAYHEEDVPGEVNLTKFTFVLPVADVEKLVRAVPVEVYARRAIITGKAGSE